MTQRERVYTMLKQAGSEGVTNGQFVDVNILRYSARIKELRDAGHRIEKHRVTGGTFRYELRRAHLACPVEEVGVVDSHQHSSALRTAESRGSSRGQGVVPLPVPNQNPAAATSGEGVETPGTGGGAPPHPAALPLFDWARNPEPSHYEYEGEAV